MHSGRIHGCFPEDKVHYAATEGTFHDDPKTGLVVVRIGENNKITAKRRQANKRPRDDDTAEMALNRFLNGSGKLQLLDRAALKCDRNFDRWNLVRLYTPNSRGGAKRIVPENCESPRAFYAEGLHRTPRPPSHPQRPAAIGPWGTGGGSLSARTPRIVNLEVLTLNARPQLSARQLV